MGQRNFKKPFEFYSLLWHGKTQEHNLSVFIQCHYTRTISSNKNMRQSLFKKHSKFQNSMKYFTVALPDSEIRIWMFLYNVSTRELF